MVLRSTFLAAALFLGCSFAHAQLNLATEAPSEETVIAFEKLEYEMGEFALGDTVHGVFKFKNAGQAPLLIENVKPSCQCTKLEYPQKPVPPGGEGVIIANIHVEGDPGESHNKWFMVFYNGNPPMERVTMKFKVKEGAAGGQGGHPAPEETPSQPEADETPNAPAPPPAPEPSAKPAKGKKKGKKSRA